MNKMEAPWWVWSLIAMVYGGGIWMVVWLVRSMRYHQRVLRELRAQRAATPEISPIKRQNNGWVIVSTHALQPEPNEESIEAYHLAGVLSSIVINRMLCSLSSQQLYDIVIEISAENEQDLDEDVLRGLTIGSALFNYSIPKSFVLLDRRTKLMYAQFRFRDLERRTVQQWVEQEGMFDRNLPMFGGVERISLGLSREDAYEFYLNYNSAIAPYLLNYTNGDHYPHMVGFVESLMRRFNLCVTNDVLIHQMYITINVMVDLMELEVPMEWVMRSPLVDAVTKIVLGEVAQRPKLTLVTKN